MSEHDQDHKLRALLEQAHRTDSPPSFRRTWSSAREGRSPRGKTWGFIPALGAAALLIFLGVRPTTPTSSPRETHAMEWNAPLDFLLQTPGAELLRTVPTFNTSRSFP